MTTLNPTDAIPLDEALRLCEMALAQNRRQWWNLMALQCRGCVRFSTHPAKRCFASVRGNRGCRYVNREWDKRAAHPSQHRAANGDRW